MLKKTFLKMMRKKLRKNIHAKNIYVCIRRLLNKNIQLAT